MLHELTFAHGCTVSFRSPSSSSGIFGKNGFRPFCCGRVACQTRFVLCCYGQRSFHLMKQTTHPAIRDRRGRYAFWFVLFLDQVLVKCSPTSLMSGQSMGRLDERLTHTQTTRPRPYSHRCQRNRNLHNNQTTTPASYTQNHFRWLNCYPKSKSA